MSSIDPATQLAALIRVQVASLRQQSAPVPGSRRQQATAAAASDEPADLARLVALRVRTIARDDPQKERKALRIFLETVLLSELGQELVSDPKFHLMVDHVQTQMESEPDLARAAQDAARVLLANADVGRSG